MEQQAQQMKEEREQEHAQYNALLSLQNKFPWVNIAGVNIGGLTLQSQEFRNSKYYCIYIYLLIILF